MTVFLLATLVLLLFTVITAHAGHDHHHHHHDHDHSESSLHTDGTQLKSPTQGHTHNCQHDAIEEILREAKAATRAEQLAAIVAAEPGEVGVDAKTVLRRRMESLSKRRETSSYHKLRITFDFSRLGETTADLVNGADTHGASNTAFTCYEGSTFNSVPDTYDAQNANSNFACNENNKFTPEKRSFLKFTLLPQAKALLENALTVADVDQAPTSPNVVWPSQGYTFNSAKYGIPGNKAWDVIPTEKTSVADTDFVLYITARPTDEGVIAWATTLARAENGRPKAGLANFNPLYLAENQCSDFSSCVTDSDCAQGKCSGNFESQLGTTVHEIVHALGFSSDSWSKFKGVSYSQVVERRSVADGSKRSFIMTPNVVAKVKAQYGCADDVGGEMENYGGSGTAGSHWEKRTVNNEFMSGTSASSPVMFSAMTLALFEDTGWYKPNYGVAGHLPWGYKQGCNFIKQTCGTGWDNKYFCDKPLVNGAPSGFGCSSIDFRARGYCDLAVYNGNAPVSYFSDKTWAGRNPHMDYCPMYVAYSNTPCNNAVNTQVRSSYGEHKSMMNENGFCFSGTHKNGAASSSAHQSCHEVSCAPDFQTYDVKLYSGSTVLTVTCPTNGGFINAPSPFKGQIECYPANLICFAPTNCPKADDKICSGHGTCGSDLLCTCEFGFAGLTCEQFVCPLGVGEVECSGTSNGACDGSTGKCNCKKIYDGMTCDRLKCPVAVGGTKGECSGHGTCTTGECTCQTGFTGDSCNFAPGCPSATTPCSGHGVCSTTSGSCSCNIKSGSDQTVQLCPDYNCPSPVQDSCLNRVTDSTKCAYWSGKDCTKTVDFSTTVTIAEDDSVTTFTTASQEYTFFKFEIDKPERDIAFVVTISDGSDVEIFASQDIMNPTSADTGNGYKWTANSVNDATKTREVLQICGEFGYQDGPRVASGSVEANPITCHKRDTHIVKGTMYVGVLAQLNAAGKANSEYTIALKIDKCSPYSCKAGNGNCEASTGNCICNTYPGTTKTMWGGIDCSSPVCLSPSSGNKVNIACSGNGDCVVGSDSLAGSVVGQPFCKCHPGYKAVDNALCNLPEEGQVLPTTIIPAHALSPTGYYFSSNAKGNEGTSLSLGKYRMYEITFPEQFTAVTVNVTGKVAKGLDSSIAALSAGQPDMIVAATQNKGLASNFENIDLTTTDYDGWVSRDLSSHDTVFRTKRPNEKWFVTVLSTNYARSALDYKIRIIATAPTSSSVGDCAKLSWEYATCSGGQGTCVIDQDNAPVCTACKIDSNQGKFQYAGATCGQKVYPVPAYKMDDSTVVDTAKMLVPGKEYTSGDEFGSTAGVSLEPGEWAYFVVDSRELYNSLTFKLTVQNTDLVQNSGVLSPLLLVKSADDGASLPSLETDPNTKFDFSGTQSSEQSVTVEHRPPAAPIASRYYVGVYNQRYSGAALKYKLIISSAKTTETKPTCASSPCTAHSSKCEDATDGRVCTCHPAWSGVTCASPVLRPTKSLLMAASNVVSLGNNDNKIVQMKRGDFRFFKIPQPLKDGQGVMLMVCDTQIVAKTTTPLPFEKKNDRRRLEQIDTGDKCCVGAGCSDPDIYVSTELPRTSYDFRLIGASPKGSKEELVVYNSSTTGRYYLAVYANYDGLFLVASKATTLPDGEGLATDNYFLVLVWEWLTSTSSGMIVGIVLLVLMCVLCTGCMFACCCTHENLHKHDNKDTFKGRVASKFSRAIGSRHPDPNHHSNAHPRGSMRMSSRNLVMQNNPQRGNGVEKDSSNIQMTALNNLQVFHDPNVGRGRGGRGRGAKTTI